MDLNVSPFVKVENLRPFSTKEIFVMSIFVLVPFTCFVANYSAYHINGFNVYCSLLAVLIYLLFGSTLRDGDNGKYVSEYFVACLLVWCSSVVFHFEMPSIKLLYELFFASCFLLVCNDGKIWIYDKFIKFLAILLFLGVVEFLLSHIGFVKVLGETVRPYSSNTMTYYQTYFNILPYYYANGTARFQSIAEEPGLVGTLCFFLLSTIDFRKYKYQAIVFWVAGILTMSLAFYALILIWAATRLKKISIKLVVVVVLGVGLTAYFFQDRIQDLVVQRVIEDSSEGSLDDRNSVEVQRLYDATFEDLGLFIYGVGNRTFGSMETGNSAGIKKMVVQYGFLMIMVVVIAFCRIYMSMNRQYRGSVWILLLWLFSLYQRFDLNLSSNIIVLFSAFLVQQTKE